MKYLLIAILLTGCSSIQMERGVKDTANYEIISYRGPPKDFTALDFKWTGTSTYLRAGEAATADQPWADVVDSGVDILGAVLFCRANPLQCSQFTEE